MAEALALLAEVKRGRAAGRTGRGGLGARGGRPAARALSVRAWASRPSIRLLSSAIAASAFLAACSLAITCVDAPATSCWAAATAATWAAWSRATSSRMGLEDRDGPGWARWGKDAP